LISGIREFLGAGKLMNLVVIKGFEPALVMAMPAGALLVIGLLLGFFNMVKASKS